MILPSENQVTSKEISEKLFKLGVRQDSLYCHCKIGLYSWPHEWKEKVISKEMLDECADYWRTPYKELIAAYTVAELLALLMPIKDIDNLVIFNSFDDRPCNICLYGDGLEREIDGLSYADCLAKLLIGLLENEGVKAECL